MDEWISRYEQSHRHPVNRFCHLVGIPMIVVSLVLIPVAIFVKNLWLLVIALFVVGWVFQFVGHVFEKKPPEFFSDWRFLLVGLRWWSYKVMGRR